MPMLIGVMMLFNTNKNTSKIILLSLVGLVVIAIILGLGRAIYLKSTEEIKSLIIEETYSKVNIDTQTEKINIYLSSDENKALYVENKNISLEVNVANDTLFIKRIDNRKFYDQMFNFTDFKLDLYLTKEVIESLKIDCSTGDIIIHDGFTFNNVIINNSTGNVTIESNVTNDLNIKNSTGNIKIKNCNDVGNINIDAGTGDVELSNINCTKLDIKISTGDTKLTNVLVKNNFNMDGSTGNLLLDDFDAANIYVNLSTGDVKGTILSSKFFVAKSDTGRVNVPETRDGGECKITTSTGNIDIKYK